MEYSGIASRWAPVPSKRQVLWGRHRYHLQYHTGELQFTLQPCHIFLDRFSAHFVLPCSSLFFLRNPKPFTGFRMLMTSHDGHDHGLVHYDQNSRLCHSALPGAAPWQAAQKQRRSTSNAFKVQCSLQTCEKTSSQTALAEVSTFCTLQVYNSDRLDFFGSIWYMVQRCAT